MGADPIASDSSPAPPVSLRAASPREFALRPPRGHWSGRIAIAFAIAIVVGSTTGAALAVVLPIQGVSEAAEESSGTGSAVPNYHNPTLVYTPSLIAACTSGLKSLTLSTGTAPTEDLELSYDGGTCATKDVGYEWVFAFSVVITTTALSQTNNITVNSEVWGGGQLFSTSELFEIQAPAMAGTYKGDLDVHVDFGSIAPLPGGVTFLDLTVQ
ncbi:MAG: hypothetical protein L3K03_01970 [Thermoplasmata archaeon]|nr:hypothetical protein [Thermoplasmata archaeon]